MQRPPLLSEMLLSAADCSHFSQPHFGQIPIFPPDNRVKPTRFGGSVQETPQPQRINENVKPPPRTQLLLETTSYGATSPINLPGLRTNVSILLSESTSSMNLAKLISTRNDH